MDIRSIPRTLVSVWLDLARIPWDLGARTVNGRQPQFALAIDRADAVARSFAGHLLRDDVLVADAEHRRAASDERARAMRLRAQADELSQAADARFEDRLHDTENQRERAEARADAARRAVEDQALAAERAVNESQARRRRSAEEAERRRKQAAAEKAEAARLEQLDDEVEALDAASEALETEQEATRLKKAAAATKAARRKAPAGARR